MIDTLVWLYILLGLGVVVVALLIKRIATVRVWIRTHQRPGLPFVETGYLKMDDSGDAAQVHVSGGGMRPAVGQVAADMQQNTQKGYVDILTSGFEDDGMQPRYRRMGYIQFDQSATVDKYGYIYKQVKGKKKREVVGYTARPSAPDVPTIYGERSWKTLWLVCTLNAYSGKPKEPEPAPQNGEDKAKAGRGKVKQKEPMAICSYKGIHNSKRDYLPPEARACAYAMLSRFAPRQNYTEYYKDQPYGWKDTALLTTVVYTLLFLLLYIVNTGVLQMPLLGHDEAAVGILIGFYYLLWALIRLIKIDAIENSNSFQPWLDLLNKNLGHKVTNRLIVLLSIPAMIFTYIYYDYDLLPLIWAIGFGVGVNMTLQNGNRRWKINSTFKEEDDTEEEEEDEEVKNPEGDISRQYDWDLDIRYSTKQVHGNLTLYFSANEIADLRHCNPFFLQRKEKSDKEYILFMFHFLKEHRQMLQRVRYISAQIDKLCQKNSLTERDKLQLTLDFVQEPNIQFHRNSEQKAINYYSDYIRYPDETLYDQAGDCNSKALLAAMLFYVTDHDVIYLASRKHQHAAIGVEIKQELIEEGQFTADELAELCISENGKYYLFCETTGDHFSIGSQIAGMELDDFEEKVLLPVIEDDVDERGEGSETRIYTWNLSAESGRQLTGSLALEFDTQLMAELREQNPFTGYGADGNTYAMNVRTIFNLLATDADYTQQVDTIAEYIRSEAKAAGLSEFDTLQFALNFAQDPNIEYRLDEQCESIDFRKEYMRFPDEVLFDMEGDCDCKSSLTAALFHALGYDVLFLISTKLKHAAIAVECKPEWLGGIHTPDLSTVVREFNGKKYLYCETTGEGNWMGHIKEGDSIMDFEEVVELRLG